MSVLVSAILKIRLVLAPVEDALANDVIETNGHKAEVNQHLPEPEQARDAGKRGQLAIDHRPRHHEHGFDVEQDEQHSNQVKAHAEAAARVSCGHNAALVRSQLGAGVAVPADKPGGNDHSNTEKQNGDDLHEQWEVLPGIRSWSHRRLAFCRFRGICAPQPFEPQQLRAETRRWFEIRFSASSRQGREPAQGSVVGPGTEDCALRAELADRNVVRSGTSRDLAIMICWVSSAADRLRFFLCTGGAILTRGSSCQELARSGPQIGVSMDALRNGIPVSERGG